MSLEHERERTVEITIRIPVLTYRLMQERADDHNVPVRAIATWQLKKINDPGLRQARMLTLRGQVFHLWQKGLSGPKIARELGCSLGTVDKHKRAIRERWTEWQGQAAS